MFDNNSVLVYEGGEPSVLQLQVFVACGPCRIDESVKWNTFEGLSFWSYFIQYCMIIACRGKQENAFDNKNATITCANVHVRFFVNAFHSTIYALLRCYAFTINPISELV